MKLPILDLFILFICLLIVFTSINCTCPLVRKDKGVIEKTDSLFKPEWITEFGGNLILNSAQLVSYSHEVQDVQIESTNCSFTLIENSLYKISIAKFTNKDFPDNKEIIDIRVTITIMNLTTKKRYSKAEKIKLRREPHLSKLVDGDDVIPRTLASAQLPITIKGEGLCFFYNPQFQLFSEPKSIPTNCKIENDNTMLCPSPEASDLIKLGDDDQGVTKVCNLTTHGIVLKSYSFEVLYYPNPKFDGAAYVHAKSVIDIYYQGYIESNMISEVELRGDQNPEFPVACALFNNSVTKREKIISCSPSPVYFTSPYWNALVRIGNLTSPLIEVINEPIELRSLFYIFSGLTLILLILLITLITFIHYYKSSEEFSDWIDSYLFNDDDSGETKSSFLQNCLACCWPHYASSLAYSHLSEPPKTRQVKEHVTRANPTRSPIKPLPLSKPPVRPFLRPPTGEIRVFRSELDSKADLAIIRPLTGTKSQTKLNKTKSGSKLTFRDTSSTSLGKAKSSTFINSVKPSEAKSLTAIKSKLTTIATSLTEPNQSKVTSMVKSSTKLNLRTSLSISKIKSSSVQTKSKTKIISSFSLAK